MLTADRPAISFHHATTQLSSLLSALETDAPFPQRLSRSSLSEAWFSDMLAWLLDVKGSHGLGTRFADRFLVKIAHRRTHGHPNEDFRYAHRKKHLRFGRSGIAGTPSTSFRLGNSSVFREFYLANATGTKAGSGAAFCDVVFLDLDPQDGLLVAVENKLFTHNRRGQLATYYRLVEEKYARALVREYVYLTLAGDPPQANQELTGQIRRAWIRLSWIGDVLDILEELPAPGSEEVDQLVQVLRWLRSAQEITREEEYSGTMEALFGALVTGATACILAELERLSEGGCGKWQIKREDRNATSLVHSSKPKVPLYVGVMPNLSIALFCRRRKRRPFDKLLIPFGSNPDQIFNLMDHAARDIYPLHFGDSHQRYLGSRRRLTASEVPVRTVNRPLFQMVHRHRHEIQMLAQITGTGHPEPA